MMFGDIFSKKHDEFDEIFKPTLENWYRKKIERSGRTSEGKLIFHEHVDIYLSHVHAVYDCVRKGMNPRDVWKTLPDVETQVVRHFESRSHDMAHKITDLRFSYSMAAPIICFSGTYKINGWTFSIELEYSGEVSIFCSTMNHAEDTNKSLYKLDFEEINEAFKQGEFMDNLRGDT